MKIKELKINGFGKLENKEIGLKDNINVIYGENEAGKSTLLKFITGMFYGLSKNKNGQAVPDIEKLKPWKTEEFSGKIKYELDNKNIFEVYRDFKKKNPNIYNNNLEEISKEFNIDKTKGNQFFYDQVGLEEDIFNSSVITKQAEVKLDEKSQNNIIQKISNILGTGEDNISYSKIVTKLKKKMMDEIGTSNSKERPINLVEKRINEIEQEKKKLEEYQNKKFEIEEIIEAKKEQIIEQKERLETLRAANINLDRTKAEETKINVAKKLIEDSKKEIEEFKRTNKEEKINERSNVNKFKTVLIIILVILSILAIIFISNLILKLLPILITAIISISIITKNNHEKASKKREYIEKLKELENKKEVQEQELSELEKKYNSAILDICKKYNIENVDTIVEQINNVQSNINELTLSVHTIEIDNKNAANKLEEFISLEEELESLKEDQKELDQKRFEIQKALDVLDIAYNKMKEEITPKFTQKLSKTIDKISNGKYKNVRINTLGEIIVEDKNGEYINADNLSLGTIDQLYLSLRLASIEEITKEKMPIILDESFAYYDNERLENILKYLSEEYKENQVIIFTCTKREIEFLNKLNINYNFIEL